MVGAGVGACVGAGVNGEGRLTLRLGERLCGGHRCAIAVMSIASRVGVGVRVKRGLGLGLKGRRGYHGFVPVIISAFARVAAERRICWLGGGCRSKRRRARPSELLRALMIMMASTKDGRRRHMTSVARIGMGNQTGTPRSKRAAGPARARGIDRGSQIRRAHQTRAKGDM